MWYKNEFKGIGWKSVYWYNLILVIKNKFKRNNKSMFIVVNVLISCVRM